MSVSPYIDTEDLRASVADVAMTLGPGVTEWMFDNAVPEEDGEEEVERHVSTPGLASSSSSSEDSHSTTLTPQDSHSYQFSRPMISYPTKLTPLSTLEDGYHLNSPFVVVDENHFPRFPRVPEFPYVPPIDTTDFVRPLGRSQTSTTSSSTQSLTPAMKKPPKGIKSSPKKPSPQGPSPQRSTPEYRPPAVPVPSSNNHDPISRPTTPSNAERATSPLPSVATPRSLQRLKKKIRFGAASNDDATVTARPGTQAWDFKDPDRPSFFALQEFGLPELPRASSSLGHADVPKGKKAKKALKAGDQADGYMSEGTGRSTAISIAKKKQSPLKRSMTSRFMSKLSSSNLQAGQPEPVLPTPMPHPIHDKFATIRSDTPEHRHPGASTNNVSDAGVRKPVFAERVRLPYLRVHTNESGSRSNTVTAEPSPSSSTSSFAIVPDLNGLSRRIQQLGHDGHAGGSNNEAKLAMLAKLITETSPTTSAETHTPSERVESWVDVELPPSTFVLPSPTTDRLPLSPVLDHNNAPVSPKTPTPTSRPPPSTLSRNRTLHAPTQLNINSNLTAPSENTRSGSAPPTMLHHRIQTRARQSPFPTKPILPPKGSNLTRSTSQSRLTQNPVLANNPRFLTPKRYEDVQTLPVPPARVDPFRPDVPRSVRSSYSKDMEREEGDGHDDKSIYSQVSNSSFLDAEKSMVARARLVEKIDVLSRH